MYGSVDNLIIGQHRELLKLTEDNFTYKELYSEISNPTLQTILSTLHYEFVKLFELMNERLPATEHSNNHYWADPSRELSAVFDIANSLVAGIKDSDDALEIDEYYLSLMKKLRPYLRSNGGSELPVGMEKVEVFYAIPIFRSMQSIKVTSPSLSQGYKLKLIGRGSYAQVFKYRDANYNRDIIVKRANSDLLQKELERFKIEFNQMKELHSPYIVEVYRYDDVHHEYTMECMDATLLDYINKNNNRLTITARIGITRQALRGFQYIHSKDLLHRDISPNNILVKEYEDVAVIKIADFGLVKIEGSTLTSTDTAFKG